MVKVIVEHLKKKYGNLLAVNNVDISVNDEEFLVLLGPSGCGKTTILRCIAGLERPDEGKIYVGDTLVNDLPPKDRDIAMVFQSHALYPHLSAFDNISFPLKIRKYPKQEIKMLVKKTAELLRIEHLLGRKPKQLSGGEAQRVALGRAIIREPKVFLMDEPLSSLDAKLRLYMRAELKKLQKELRTTTIYVTHDQAEAMTMSDRIAIMNHGVLQQLDSPSNIYNQPKNTFVAGFLGSPPMNFVELSFVEKNRKGWLDAGVFSLRLSDRIAEMIKTQAPNSELVLGVRPEDIAVHEECISPEAIETNVYLVEPLGSEIIVDLKIGEHLIKARTPPDSKLHVGDKIWITLNNERFHVFDKKTERVIC
jgi:multiple sugar transport system ATP-binding protein